MTLKPIILSSAIAASAMQAMAVNPDVGDHYLYCHMSGRGEWTAYAISPDGVHYHDLIGGDPVFDPASHARIEGGTRDAYICRRADGKGFLMVTTDMKVGKSHQWYNYGIDLYTSPDLINWQSVTFDFREGPSIFSDKDAPDTYKDYSTVRRVWAPQVMWNPDHEWPDGRKGGYMVYYSLLNDVNGEDPYDRMYYSYADSSFTTLTKPKLMFDWGYATIDADINYVEADGLYHLMIKKEGGKPGLYTATSATLEGPYSEPVEDDYIDFEGNKKCEGVSAFRIEGEPGWRIGYIEYSSKPKNYRICRADENMRNFSDPENIKGVAAPQHGSFMRITKEEYDRLQAWSDSIEESRMGAYLMTYFSDDDHSLHFAISRDGYRFKALNDNKPVIAGDTIAEQKGIRDPHIYRGPDGKFYLTMTDLHIFGKEAGYRDTRWERPDEYGWGNNRGLVMMTSTDLINWKHAEARIDKLFPDEFGEISCAWAPQTVYDPAAGAMMVYFTIRKRAEHAPGVPDGDRKTKLYYAYANKDFTSLATPPRLLYTYPDSAVQVLDADICPMPDGRYFMTYVSQEGPCGIKMAYSGSINTGYDYHHEQIDAESGSCEAPNVWKRIGEDKWVLMYDIFSIKPHNFGFVETSDFKTFTPLGRFNEGPMKALNFSSPKHGAVIHITSEEADRLEEHWPSR